ncbi:MAG TPA: HlyD family efflux transporter periplasmic adaptor subunit [Gemmatimonadaceae bacterium]|nr:HlyD family efflux transporter periplasmic adaptor subunit [Gemmatimonadaceae bacterium]
MDIKREPVKKRGKYIAGAVGIVAIVGVSLALGNLEKRAPSVDRAIVMIDSVQRGTMVRNVRAPGTLVPEHIRYVVAVTSGRLEQLPVRAGAEVTDTTVLLVMSNPDVQLEALNAERELTNAQSNLLTLRTNLRTAQLAQQSTVANLETLFNNARREYDTFQALAKKDLASTQEIARTTDQMKELETRLEIEKTRLKVQSDAIDGQIRLAEENLERLRAINEFQRERVASMRVTAGEAGVLQQLGTGQTTLELGQYVLAGSVLATIAQPGELKAVLRIPESQAKDVVPGQKASIDTRNGIVEGRVTRVDPISQGGSVEAEVAIEGELPRGARAQLSVDGTIEIERLADVMYVGRPAYGQAESTVGLFKLDEDGSTATRVNVQLGRSSVNTIEIKNGLQVGDRVIISDMTQYDQDSKVRIK